MVRILLDTNIVIHREATTVVNEDIGVLFWWVDHLHHTKCIHPVTVEEIEKHQDPKIRKSFEVKLGNYDILKTLAPLSEAVLQILKPLDINQNDINDTAIINELYCRRVDALITEDKRLLNKALLLGILDKVFTIDAFLEKVTAENPELADYKVLSVRKSLFGNLDLSDDFFTSFKEDYPGFEEWFNKKADETVYVCLSGDKPIAFLYLKLEGKEEDYSDIEPPLAPKRRLKIGSFKVTVNGYRLGERFLKIVFDNALRLKVDEIYVTIFDRRIEQQRLINLLEEYGFQHHGMKNNDELVYYRSIEKKVNYSDPKRTYPFFSTTRNIFLVPIRPEYHTELLPDSILRNESPIDYIENEPHRNAISKVYISRSSERNLHSGDILVFYRTGGYYRSVVTTIGVVEGIIDNIKTEADFIRLCRKRSVFTDKQLSEQWNLYPRLKPFIVNFLYVYSFPTRINMQKLIEIGIIPSVNDAPRGFVKISVKNLRDILKECQADESIAVD
ncbi:MAG TPA: PIN domain-containing protein [Dehalococcoidales bacterium]